MDLDSFLTTRLGIALGGQGEERPGDPLRNADLAMYQAKAKGNNRHAIYEPGMNEGVLERLEL